MSDSNLVSVPTSCRAIHLPQDDDESRSFTFVLIADPQLGLLERYVEKRPLPHHWDRELANLNRAIRLINRIYPKPLFIVACGDLTDAQPGMIYREEQTHDLLESFNKLDNDIKLFCLPGNHDVGDEPTEDNIRSHVQIWGADYYTFEVSNAKFIVLNSQLMWSDKNCEVLSQSFHAWLEEQLNSSMQDGGPPPIVLQHIPYFVDTSDEPDGYFNIPQPLRQTILSKFHKAGVSHVFTGHLHKNSSTSWAPHSNTNPIHLVTTTSTGVQLGEDKPGIRLVQVVNGRVTQHKFWPLDDLELLLNNDKQPDF